MRKVTKIALVYVALQALIGAKSFAYFYWFGFGAVNEFNQVLFSGPAILFDFFFHEAMHAAIGLLALSFGKNLAKVEWSRLAPEILFAVAIHNVGYWLTRVHQSPLNSAKDFVSDFVLVFAFVLVGFSLRRQINRFKLLNAL